MISLSIRPGKHFTRGLVETGDNVLIGGFIVLGDNAATPLLRAIGPSLPLTGSLADPHWNCTIAMGRLYLDNWRSDQESEFSPPGSRRQRCRVSDPYDSVSRFLHAIVRGAKTPRA